MKPQNVTTPDKSLADRSIRLLLQWLQTNKYCIVSTLVAGLVAHLYFLSHKIPSLDDPLLTYGYDVSSGRWGIWLLKQLVPPASMPWFNGLVTIALTAVTTTLTAQMLDIKRPLTQVLLSAVIVTSALYVCLFSYMATCTPYAIAILLATLATRLFLDDRPSRWALSALCLLLCISIYQMYGTLYMTLLLVKCSLHLLEHGKIEWAKTLRMALRLGGLLLATGAVYFLITWSLGGIESAVSYGMDQEAMQPWPKRILGTYAYFIRYFTRGFAGLINTPLSLIAHGILAASVVVLVLTQQWKRGGVKLVLCQAALFIALPLIVNSALLVFKPSHLNTLTVYSIVAVYYLAAALAERYSSRWHAYDIIGGAIILIVLSNIYFDNRTYLKMQIAYNNATAFFGGIATQVKLMPELTASSKLALVGEASTFQSDTDTPFGGNIRGTASLINRYYAREPIIHDYIGLDITVADPYECKELAADPRVQAMPVYPFYGSIQAIDSVIVVKLGEQH